MKTDPGNALGLPPLRGEETARYVITARPHRSFHTVLDAHALLDPARAHLALVTTRVPSVTYCPSRAGAAPRLAQMHDSGGVVRAYAHPCCE